jgi:NAD(P)-dependent dehydrogenase (short-subunit alcohol dehydrogenase family)
VSVISGKRVVVAGASRGIGAAVSEILSRHGADVVRVSRSAAETGGVSCDLTNEDSVRLAVQTITAGGPPSILVNNVGSFLLQSVTETTPNDFRHQIDSNLVGPFLFLRELLPAMSVPGQMVTIGSVVDYQVFPGNGAYAAAKHGLRALHEVTAVEQRGRIKCTLLSPGATDTELWDEIDPDTRDDLPDRVDMLRAADVAEAVLFAVTRPAHVNIDVLRMGAV